MGSMPRSSSSAPSARFAMTSSPCVLLALLAAPRLFGVAQASERFNLARLCGHLISRISACRCALSRSRSSLVQHLPTAPLGPVSRWILQRVIIVQVHVLESLGSGSRELADITRHNVRLANHGSSLDIALHPPCSHSYTTHTPFIDLGDEGGVRNGRKKTAERGEVGVILSSLIDSFSFNAFFTDSFASIFSKLSICTIVSS